ncbi:NADH-quinone oxidoreductase subunit B family protein [Methanospirillum sp. J.3.6.1-F.2.7.3]|uniref:NADH-quinone oxidoreductase subunit B family protein n=1 Tax=Methanospirillum purgamenti TaxID=2834276 RepID=A0A8E7B2I6_9EURY|nr:MULTISPECIES: NADH-quinone oxidoreductase subunit B family protein [Methanospirillum]MDX8551464.1 NADH-quinone oxidoreductase subunit B family protein [Methanospirillum hungatei]QVV89921.1 NADH-quinone oxidoreductase subunit B family protein [Methanospirillum sp. J.3.6.1-F.2.7.3]
MNILSLLLKKPKVTRSNTTDPVFESTGLMLRQEIDRVFGNSIAIREVDCGSDNAAEIELANLSAPHYDVERFGITFVASPRHADVLAVTGVVTHAMKEALIKTYEATPEPKFVIAVGDDACTGGIFAESYAVLGPVDSVIPVDLKIPGNPPTPSAIMKGLLMMMQSAEKR